MRWVIAHGSIFPFPPLSPTFPHRLNIDKTSEYLLRVRSTKLIFVVTFSVSFDSFLTFQLSQQVQLGMKTYTKVP
ncbi:hypothetical protein IJ00_13850 [Calothrix sp. 336/3]|nr:hypothetical protein IJ00_13850 [Calothrix sp. 336/3]